MNLQLENKKISIYDPKNHSTHDSKLITHLDEWTILFFYPADFSIVCPTELKGLQEHKKELESYGAKILVISRDSHYTHQQWVNSDSHLKDFDIDMVSDRDAEI
jgi:peroxiredoxin (alkyl hydroperoxide reductase subunit C)